MNPPSPDESLVASIAKQDYKIALEHINNGDVEIVRIEIERLSTRDLWLKDVNADEAVALTKGFLPTLASLFKFLKDVVGDEQMCSIVAESKSKSGDDISLKFVAEDKWATRSFSIVASKLQQDEVARLNRVVADLRTELLETKAALADLRREFREYTAKTTAPEWDHAFSGALYRFEGSTAHFASGNWSVARVRPFHLVENNPAVTFGLHLDYGWFGIGDRHVVNNAFPGYQQTHAVMICTDGRIYHNNSELAKIPDMLFANKVATLRVNKVAKTLTITCEGKEHTTGELQCIPDDFYFMVSVSAGRIDLLK